MTSSLHHFRKKLCTKEAKNGSSTLRVEIQTRKQRRTFIMGRSQPDLEQAQEGNLDMEILLLDLDGKCHVGDRTFVGISRAGSC